MLKKKKNENDDTFRHTQTINPKLIFFIYDLFKTNLNQFLPPQKKKKEKKKKNLNQFFYYQTLSFEEKY